MSKYFYEADILLPDFEKNDGEKWAVIACDQHTSEPEYWQAAKDMVADAPSTLELILPEVYLEETEARVPMINGAMEKYVRDILLEHKDSMILLERT